MGLRDAGTTNGALRSPRIAQERRGEKEGEGTSRGAILPFARAQQRAIEANGRDETLRGMCDRSRFQGWKRRDVQEDVQEDIQAERCARAGNVSPERCAGSRAGGDAEAEQFKVILEGVTAKRCFPNS